MTTLNPKQHQQLTPQMVRSPIRWVGGKSQIRKKIISMLPPHSCYVEVFAGAAWVLFGKPPSKVEVLNDLDGELINFFRVVKEHPQTLIKSFEYDLASREKFEDLRNTDPTTLDPIQRAHRFYYLIMAGWGGEFNVPRFQTSVNDGGHGNRFIGSLKSLNERILPAYQRLQTVIIEHLDWQACVKRYDKPSAVMFLDPPYPGNSCNYRFNLRSWDEHQAIAAWMSKAKAKCLLTTYDLPKLRKLYDDFYITPVSFRSGMVSQNGRRNHEIIVTNYDPKPMLLQGAEEPVH